MDSTIKTRKKIIQNFPWRSPSLLSNLKILFVLLLLGFLTPDLTAQVPVIDGNPSEWPGILNDTANHKKGFKHDPFNTLHVDNQWTGGSSDADASPAANWHWVLGNSNDK